MTATPKLAYYNEIFPPLAGEQGVTNLAYPPLHLHRYGAVGDGVTDDSNAARAACAALQMLGGGTIRGIPGKSYVIYSPSADNGPGTVTISGGGTIATFSVPQAANFGATKQAINLLLGQIYEAQSDTSATVKPIAVVDGGYGVALTAAADGVYAAWRYVRPSLYGFYGGVTVAFEDIAFVTSAAQDWSSANAGVKVSQMFSFTDCQSPTFRRCTHRGPTVDTSAETTADASFKGRYFSNFFGGSRAVLYEDCVLDNLVAVTIVNYALATTGAMSLSATATGYARTAGSFLADGFTVGKHINPSGFGVNVERVVTAVTALGLDVAGGCAVEAAAAGRSLTGARTTGIEYRRCKSTNVIYGIEALQNGDNIKFDWDIDDCHRAFVLDGPVGRISGRIGCVNNKSNSQLAGSSDVDRLVYVDRTSTSATPGQDKIRFSSKQTAPITSRNIALVFDVAYDRDGVGTVSCTAGATTFIAPQPGLVSGSALIVGGVTYAVSAVADATHCTLAGAPTFGASSFTRTDPNAGGCLFAVRKYLADGTTVSTVDDGSVVDGLTLSGVVRGGPLGAPEGYAIQMAANCGFGQSGTPDKWSRIAFRDLKLTNGALVDWTTDANTDALVLENVDAGATAFRIRRGKPTALTTSTSAASTPPSKGALSLKNVIAGNLDVILNGAFPLRTRLLPAGAGTFADTGGATPANPRAVDAFALGALHSTAGRTDATAVVYQLPAATVGATVPFIRMHTSSAVQLTPATGDTIRGGAANDVLQLQAIGNGCSLLCQAAGTWEINSRAGTLYNATAAANWPT